MVPLPFDRLPIWEAWLENHWTRGRWSHRRDAIACGFGMMGLRWCEVSAIQVGDLAESGVLNVHTGKRGRPRRIDVPASLVDAALNMRGFVDYEPREFLFVTAGSKRMSYQSIRRFVREATLDVFGKFYSFHCFRHTAAIRVYRRTRDVLAVSRFLGHKSLQWTQSYLVALEVVDIGGPVAFSDSVAVHGPRIFDPDCVGPARDASRRRELAVGEHVCSVNDLMPLRHGSGVMWRCTVCGLTLGGDGSTTTAALPSASATTPRSSVGPLPQGKKRTQASANVSGPDPDGCGVQRAKQTESATRKLLPATPATRAKVVDAVNSILHCDHRRRSRRRAYGGVAEFCDDCGKWYGMVPPALLEEEALKRGESGARGASDGSLPGQLLASWTRD